MDQKPVSEIYSFSCTCCGDCCTGSMNININLYDLYKLVKRLELDSSDQLFERNLIRLVTVQNGIWTPQIIFKEKPFAFCPWLINDLGEDGVLRGFCSLHPHDKPLICKMAPVSRTVDFDDDTISYNLTSPTENCPGMKINQENRLSDLKEELGKEFEYEYRYYRILDHLVGMKKDRSFFETFYSFRRKQDFEDILTEREEAVGIKRNRNNKNS